MPTKSVGPTVISIMIKNHEINIEFSTKQNGHLLDINLSLEEARKLALTLLNKAEALEVIG